MVRKYLSHSLDDVLSHVLDYAAVMCIGFLFPLVAHGSVVLTEGM
jgi:hypothetical protein